MKDCPGNCVKLIMPHREGNYRLRVGDWRILFTSDEESKVLYVYAILPKGENYKG